MAILFAVFALSVSQAEVATASRTLISGRARRGIAWPYPIPTPAVQPPPCTRLPPGPPPPALPPPRVAESSIPIVTTSPPRHVSLESLRGKGLWITVFPGDRVNPAQLVAIARRAHLDSLYVRTGSSFDDFYGGPLLAKLVPLAHRYGIHVIAWDFPTLSNPAVDAKRAAVAFRYGVDAFSPDIEEQPEGTYITARRVAYYLSLVRKFARSRPVVATVPRPTTLSLASYPYSAEAPFIDAFAPMVYWSCTEPGAAVAVAIKALRPLRPVVPIGQDYNMGSEGGPVGLPSGLEVWRFLDVARRDGALGISLYDLESGGPVQLAALTAFPWTELGPIKS
ncbi:MAG: hypothetical protein WB770_08255 [Acidimicrobiales bacterium]